MRNGAATHLPTFLIIGAEKAGTTWLHSVLSRHRDIFLPDIKELHFFNRQDSNGRTLANFERGMDWYADHFTARGTATAWGEVTPLYLCDPAAGDRIARSLPDVRIIILLRNPIERAWSHYRMALAKGHLDGPIDARLDARDPRLVARSLYAGDLARWTARVPKSRLHVSFFEALTGAGAHRELVAIANFLGVDPIAIPADAHATGARNAATGYRSAWAYNVSVRSARALRHFPATAGVAKRLKALGAYDFAKRLNRTSPPALRLSPAQRDRLRALFARDVDAVADLLGQTPPWPEFLRQDRAAC